MRRKKQPYSKGELNRLIESLLHPLFTHNPELMAIDVFLHGMGERNPFETAVKFIRYTLPMIVQKTIRKR